ncbi:MAG TPA: hypothetical protein VJI69_09060 [Bacteroidia bacterium]|nr:hypothetical protein [Bacteroidia bacterium]
MKIIFTSILTLVLTFGAIAQKVEVNEGSENFSVGNKNAIIVVFQHDDKDRVEKEWKSLIKDFHPDNVSDKKHEYFFDNVKFTSISANTIDVYSIVLGKDNEIRLMACFDLGGAYASSSTHSKEMAYFKVLAKDFAIKMTKDYYEHKVKEATKVLEKLTDKQTDLEKDNKDLEKDIVDYKEKIKKAEDKIEQNKKDIETKKTEIGAQQKVVDELKANQTKVK